MKQYPIFLEREEDGGYSVYAPDLPGCVSQGETREEATRNIQEAIVAWIETAIEAGYEVPAAGSSLDFVSIAS